MTSHVTSNPNANPDPKPSEASSPSDESKQNEESINPEVAEDDPQLLDASSRSLTADVEQEAKKQEPSDSPSILKASSGDDTGDTHAIPDEEDTPAGRNVAPCDWSNEKSIRTIAVELKHIETEVRGLLNTRDAKRKRKLAGTRRWLELEEDLLAWQHSGWMDEESIQRLQRLVIRRHYLFQRLKFLASTRPTWNS